MHNTAITLHVCVCKTVTSFGYRVRSLKPCDWPSPASWTRTHGKPATIGLLGVVFYEYHYYCYDYQDDGGVNSPPETSAAEPRAFTIRMLHA